MTTGNHIGCLLIHGFTSSPTEMAGLATFLKSKGYGVRLTRLPGHGSDPNDLLSVTYRDWLQCVENDFAAVCAVSDQQFVIGLSLGGALALHLAARRHFAGVVALAPALKIPNWKVALARLLAPLKTTRLKKAGPDVRDPAGKLLLDSYSSYPIAALQQVFRLQRFVRAELADIQLPLLVIHSKQDHTVPFGNVDYLLKQVRSQAVEVLALEESYHVLTVDVERDLVFARVAAFLERKTECAIA